MADVTSPKPISTKLMALREKVMSNNGIHTVYPLGQDRNLHYGERFNVYQKFTVRVFGYVQGFSTIYDWGLNAQGLHAVVKISDDKDKIVQARFTRSDGSKLSLDSKYKISVGDHYSFAIQAKQTKDGKATGLEAMYENDPLHTESLPWEGVYLINHNSGSNKQLSTHFGDGDETADFPKHGLENYLVPCVRFEVGSCLIYTGLYKGDDPIALKDTFGVVPDLGRPAGAGTIQRVVIRITTRKFLFTSNYGSETVVVDFKDLVARGYNYIPRFQPNFIVTHVLIESNRYSP